MAASLGILILCFNHERFIAQCLDSVLNQKTNYEFEIHVFDDFSSDNSRKILRKCQANFPKCVKLNFRRRRVGAKSNFIHGYNSLPFKYICYLDGDDYWTDAEKIEKQVSFLEKNPSFVGTASNTSIVDNGGRIQDIMIKKPLKPDHTIDDLIDGTSYFHASGILYKNIFQGALPKAQHHPLAGDWFLSMLYAEHGKIRYFDEIMSAYRMNPEGVWSSLSPPKREIRNIEGMAAYDRLLSFKYQDLFKRIWWACDDIVRRRICVSPLSLDHLSIFFLMKSIAVSSNPHKQSRAVFSFFYKIISYRWGSCSWNFFFYSLRKKLGLLDKMII